MLVFSLRHSLIRVQGGKNTNAADTVKENPLEIAERTALEVSSIYVTGTFSVNRELYGNDEALCSALDQVIWVSEHGAILLSLLHSLFVV